MEPPSSNLAFMIVYSLYDSLASQYPDEVHRFWEGVYRRQVRPWCEVLPFLWSFACLILSCMLMQLHLREQGLSFVGGVGVNVFICGIWVGNSAGNPWVLLSVPLPLLSWTASFLPNLFLSFSYLILDHFSPAYLTYLWTALVFSRDFHTILLASIPFYSLLFSSTTFQ